MKFIEKEKTGIGYRKLLELEKHDGTYEDVKNDISKENYIRDEVLISLLKEQGYICAYCMREITLSNSTIEHIIGQNYEENGEAIGKANQIKYDNFLAVCKGDSCRNQLHCDKSRAKYQKNRPLFSNPLSNQIVQNIKFSETGVIYYKKFLELEKIEKLKKYDELGEDDNIRFDLHVVLNLNCQSLKEKRASILKAIKKLSKNGAQKDKLKKLLDNYENKKNDKYEEFCEVVIKYINKII
jgi:uncharacterized protein (TIGR02646 family)